MTRSGLRPFLGWCAVVHVLILACLAAYLGAGGVLAQALPHADETPTWLRWLRDLSPAVILAGAGFVAVRWHRVGAAVWAVFAVLCAIGASLADWRAGRFDEAAFGAFIVGFYWFFGSWLWWVGRVRPRRLAKHLMWILPTAVGILSAI